MTGLVRHSLPPPAVQPLLAEASPAGHGGRFLDGHEPRRLRLGPVGTASDFATARTTSTDFASIQALAQTLLTGLADPIHRGADSAC